MSIKFHEKDERTSPLAHLYQEWHKESKNYIESQKYQSILWQMLHVAAQEENFREYCVQKPLLLAKWGVKYDTRRLLLWYFKEWDWVKFWFFDGDETYDESKGVWETNRYSEALDFGGLSSLEDYSKEKFYQLTRSWNPDDIVNVEKLILNAIEKRKTESWTYKDLVGALS